MAASRRDAAPEPRRAHDGASSAAAEVEVTNALRRALMESEATNALVRRLIATDDERPGAPLIATDDERPGAPLIATDDDCWR